MTSLGAYMSLKALSPGTVSVEPIWAKNAHKNEKAFKEWFSKHLPVLESFNQYRIWNEWNNLLWYTGEILDVMEGIRAQTDLSGFRDKARRTLPFWVSHLSDLIDKRATDLASLKPNFEVVPPAENITHDTRTASRVVRPILNHIKAVNNLELMFDEGERSNVTYGTEFFQIDWNAKSGSRLYKDRKNKREEAEFKWEGEVEIKQIFPWHMLAWPAYTAWSAPIAVQIYDIVHVDEARKRYGDNSMQPDSRSSLFSFASPWESDLLPEQVVIYRVVHKPTEFLPEGVVVLCNHLGNAIDMKYEKYPYSHNDFPWEMHTDIVMLGKTFPYSIMNHLKPLQWTYNLLGGMIKKNIFLCAHPKWMMVKGSANPESLGNSATIVRHKAGQQPSLVQYNTVGAEVFNFRGNVKEEMRQLAGSFGLSSGEVPPNTRSGIQISRLMNIEKMNRSYQMGKRNDFMRRVLLKAASVAGDYYPTMSEANLVRILGPELAKNIEVLKDRKIADQCSIKIENASGFSDDLAGRLEEVAFANEKLPGLITLQQAADIIGVRSSQKFYDVGTAALRMAQAENEAFKDGKKVATPLMEQDHIVHWQEHVIDMQTPQHAILPENIRKARERHVAIHEMMMEEIRERANNPVFVQKLMMLERYPLFFKQNLDKAVIQNEQQLQPPASPDGEQMATPLTEGQEPPLQ